MIAGLVKPVAGVLVMMVSGSQLPHLDIHKICHDRDVVLQDAVESHRCRSDERHAQAELKNKWPRLSADVKGQCLIEPLPPSPSYMVLNDCIDNALIVERSRKGQDRNPPSQ